MLLIEPFEGQIGDTELRKLIPFLKELATLEDVRNVDIRYLEYTMKLKEEEDTEKKLAKEREKTQLESEKLGSKEKSAQTKRLEEGKTLECIEGAVNA